VLAADTVVALGNRVLGKPEDEREARAFLTLLSGRRHCVIGAICVADPLGGTHDRVVTTAVRFWATRWRWSATSHRANGATRPHHGAIHFHSAFTA
jgi:predicted house-cleaning NTP pyrophosphatase (Maf/HAM1 superfamily)